MPRRADILVLAVALVAFVLLVVVPAPPSVRPDGREYDAFARAILSGEIFHATSGHVPRALGTRTPGYPALLALAELVTPNLEAAVLALHVVLGVLTLIYFSLALRPECPVPISAASVLLAQWRMQSFLREPLTEWTCLSGLLVLFAGSVSHWREPRLDRLAALGALCAFLILAKPALIVLGAIPLALAVLQADLSRAKAAAVAFIPFALIPLWMAFNLHRLGGFTMSTFGGVTLAGVASMVGHAEVREGDDPALRTLIREMNAGKRPPPGETLDDSWLGAETQILVFNYNVFQVAEVARKRHGWDRVTYDRMLTTYALRTLRSHPGAWAAYVGKGLGKRLSSLPLLLASLLLASLSLVRGRNRPLALGLSAMLGLYVVHLVLCATVNVVVPRHDAITYNALLASFLVVLAASLRDSLPLLRGADGDAEAPGCPGSHHPPRSCMERACALAKPPTRTLHATAIGPPLRAAKNGRQ